jgi:hypothetical protein
MLRRIAGTVCSVAFAALALVVLPGVTATTASAATSPAPSSPASPDPGGYPAQSPLLTVTSGTVKVGGAVTVTGRGFTSGEVIDIFVTYGPANHALGSGGPVAQPAAFTFRHDVARATMHAVAASSGEFSAQVPLTQAGNATITATGEQSHMSVVATVSVLSATSAAATKSTKRSFPISKIELLILGLAIVAALAAAEVVWKRKRVPSAAHDVSTA